MKRGRYMVKYLYYKMNYIIIPTNQCMSFYTTIRAEELYKQKKPVYWWTIIIYPLAKFIVIYFYQKGILDGISGLLIALQMSFHSFLVRGKLWKLWEASKKYS